MPEDDAWLRTELEELRAEANALTARLTTRHDSRSRYTGADPNDLMRVTVDGHGRATEVVVARDWRHHTDPSGLASALLTAAGEAQLRRLAGALDGAAPPLPDRGGAPSSLDASGPALIRELLPMLERAERQLDEAASALARNFAEPVRLRSPGEECAITVRHGQIGEIEFDGRWIASAGADEVAHVVCQLLQNAHDRALAGIGEALPRELADLLAFAADPARMLRRLGLDP